MLNEVVKRLETKKIKIELEPEVKELIASKGIDKNFGARPLRRTIQNILEDKLAEEILDGNLKKDKEMNVGVKDNKIVVKKNDFNLTFTLIYKLNNQIKKVNIGESI